MDEGNVWRIDGTKSQEIHGLDAHFGVVGDSDSEIDGAGEPRPQDCIHVHCIGLTHFSNVFVLSFFGCWLLRDIFEGKGLIAPSFVLHLFFGRLLLRGAILLGRWLHAD